MDCDPSPEQPRYAIELPYKEHAITRRVTPKSSSVVAGRDDLELRAPITPVDPDDAADFFNQTGKHNLRRRLFLEQLTSTASNRNRRGLFPKKQGGDQDENWRQHTDLAVGMIRRMFGSFLASDPR